MQHSCFSGCVGVIFDMFESLYLRLHVQKLFNLVDSFFMGNILMYKAMTSPVLAVLIIEYVDLSKKVAGDLHKTLC